MAKLLLVSNAGANYANAGPGDTGLKPKYQFTYDFAVLGGAISTIVLTQVDGPLPNKFIIQNAMLDIITPLDSATHVGFAGLSTGQVADDLVTAIIVAGTPWSAIALKATKVLIATITTQIKATAARSPSIVISAEALSAGKFNLFIEGFQSV